ncbi:nitrate reductase cytochrome c-type subunit [Kiloniella sp. b19]|uniref:nitrate reductase cytochrome c-type subunit n=1 Tax=Kiloniella sp. GXU_MW_B19 TaxID=3141326 RepID=UPI0031CF19DC
MSNRYTPLKAATAAVALGLMTFCASALAQDVTISDPHNIANLRGGPLVETPDAPAINKVVNSDKRQVRNYPDQPPVIPHKIDGYQIDLNANKCMTCHSRTAVGESQAPMISVTHFADRDGQFLATVSPRRYFCTQCHVSQDDTPPLIQNTFKDVDSVLKSGSE